MITEEVADVKAKVQEEREKEQEIKDELEGLPMEKWDHEDFFVLEACYGLYRLLPRQSNVLAQDWLVQSMHISFVVNSLTRSSFEQRSIHSVQSQSHRQMDHNADSYVSNFGLFFEIFLMKDRYNDIVVFMNENENPPKETKQKPMSVNVIECLLRGVMRNDEPVAPLNFLLSPKFLATDRSRVSVFAIVQCLGYMPDGGLTNMIKVRRIQFRVL